MLPGPGCGPMWGIGTMNRTHKCDLADLGTGAWPWCSLPFCLYFLTDPWANNTIPLCFSFFICAMRPATTPAPALAKWVISTQNRVLPLMKAPAENQTLFFASSFCTMHIPFLNPDNLVLLFIFPSKIFLNEFGYVWSFEPYITSPFLILEWMKSSDFLLISNYFQPCPEYLPGGQHSRTNALGPKTPG